MRAIPVPLRKRILELYERGKRVRRGTFTSVKALVAAIEEFLSVYHENPIKFAWTKDTDMILGKIEHCKEALVTPHNRIHRIPLSH